MKLKNKKTGEIGYFCFANWDNPVLTIMDKNGVQLAKYHSLAELNEEWEDYEEPKVFWYIYGDQVLKAKCDGVIENMNKPIGNYFENEEEAEKAVEKLKAWERLKDKKFKFRKWRTADIGGDKYYFAITAEADDADKADLDLLFSGGEE